MMDQGKIWGNEYIRFLHYKYLLLYATATKQKRQIVYFDWFILIKT